MTSDDLEIFSARLVELGELFDATLSAAKQLLYFEALEDLPLTDVLDAVRSSAKVCTFMPKPAEIRKLAVGDEDDLTERAWMIFRHAMRAAGAYASVVTTDVALGDSIVTVFQSWPDACHTDLSPEMWASKRKEFGRVYRVLRDQSRYGVRYLLGICEQGSSASKYIPVAVIDGDHVRMIRGDEADAYRQHIATASHRIQRLITRTEPQKLEGT